MKFNENLKALKWSYIIGVSTSILMMITYFFAMRILGILNDVIAQIGINSSALSDISMAIQALEGFALSTIIVNLGVSIFYVNGFIKFKKIRKNLQSNE